MHLEMLIDNIQGCLGTNFQCFSNQIGNTNTNLGYHGYIGLIIFIHENLLRCNVVPSYDLEEQIKDKKHHQIALGKNLGVTRASNKGGVSITIPITLEKLGFTENAYLTFISCHLASDKKGVSKVEKRNKDALEIIKELSLDSKDYVIVMGDLNYRVDLAPDDVLQTVVQAAGAQDSSAWIYIHEHDQLINSMASGGKVTILI